MILSLNTLLPMVWRTIKNPREGAEEVLSLGIPREALWPLLVLVLVLSIILGQITTLLVASAAGVTVTGPLANPMVTGVLQFALLLVTIFAIHVIGRSFGGTGNLGETILLVAWLQFVMVCIQVVQTAFMLILPPVGSLLGIVGLVLFLWLLTNFVAVVHGFRSLGQVFVMILVSMFVLAFVLSILLTLAGVSVPGQI
ncbi:Yip1 family protein [Palleronia sp. KMU-117]|uniref:Yip1 family protein n=1 Tax=Palleronia sp. KMU-117 TaxID=3434108 RepID=UPI003D747DD3